MVEGKVGEATETGSQPLTLFFLPPPLLCRLVWSSLGAAGCTRPARLFHLLCSLLLVELLLKEGLQLVLLSRRLVRDATAGELGLKILDEVVRDVGHREGTVREGNEKRDKREGRGRIA